MDDGVALRTDQVADLAFYMRNPRALALSEPGVGKTPPIVVMQYYLWSVKGIATVWTQPKRLLEKNKAEIHRFTHFTDEEVVIVDGTPAEVQAQLASPTAKVFLMGFRRFTMVWEKLPPRVKAMMIDESHMGYKTSSSANCQAMFNFMNQRGEYFIAMTGTLVNGKLTSAYPVIHVIEPRYYASYKEFENYHGIYDFNNKIIGWRNHEKLSIIFGTHGIRRLFRDIYGPQEIVYQTQVVPMNDKQREMYETFEKDAILELDKFFINGTQPGVGFIRARQIMEHPNHFPDPVNLKSFVDIMPGELPAKEELLDIHLEDHAASGDPLIIYSAMRPQQERIEAMLRNHKLRYGVINGSTPQRVSSQIDLDFQAGKIQVVLCSPACASVGFNWGKSGDKEVCHIIFLTTDFLDSTFTQAVARAVRGKRTAALRVTVMEYEKSMDQKMLWILYQKSIEANKVDPTRPIVNLSKWTKS